MPEDKGTGDMSKKKEPLLQMNLFEPGITDTVEVTELYGAEPGGIFDFIGLDWKTKTIETCWGDLRVMCDVLEDYADTLERVIKEWNLEGYHAYSYELHAARCRKISRKYAGAIGYDRAAALEKCRKRRENAGDDIGEEAMALMAKYGAKKAKEELEAKTPGKAPAAELRPPEEPVEQIGMF